MTKSFTQQIGKLEVQITFDAQDIARVFKDNSDPKLNALYGKLFGPAFGSLAESDMASAVSELARLNEAELKAEREALKGGKA